MKRKKASNRWLRPTIAIAGVLLLLFIGVKISTVIYEKYMNPDRTSSAEGGSYQTLPEIDIGPVTTKKSTTAQDTVPTGKETEQTQQTEQTGQSGRTPVWDTEYTGALEVDYTRPPGRRILTGEDFGYALYKSPHDANKDGIDDQTQFVMGAKEFLARNPQYDSRAYYQGGYPFERDGELKGVCTDVISFALLAAGYDLKALIDADMQAHPENYINYSENFDLNMNFRRVRNQYCFFMQHADILTTDLTDREAWQPGDIVVFGNVHASQAHIALVSTRRAEDGVPYVLHLASRGQTLFEEDYLTTCQVNKPILAHFRYNGYNGE